MVYLKIIGFHILINFASDIIFQYPTQYLEHNNSCDCISKYYDNVSFSFHIIVSLTDEAIG